jgi:hypothetical protein
MQERMAERFEKNRHATTFRRAYFTPFTEIRYQPVSDEKHKMDDRALKPRKRLLCEIRFFDSTNNTLSNSVFMLFPLILFSRLHIGFNIYQFDCSR